MRVMVLVVALFLIPGVAAQSLSVQPGMDTIGGVMVQALVSDENTGPSSHENMKVELGQDGRIWFQSDTLHEHDAFSVFATGLPGMQTLTVEAADQSQSVTTNVFGHDVNQESAWEMEVFDGRSIQVEGNALVEAVAYGENGVWLRSWIYANERTKTWAEALRVGEEVSIQFRGLGQVVGAQYAGGEPVPALKSPTEDPLPPCGPGEVLLDPPEVHVGAPIRVAVEPGTDGLNRVNYRLLQDVASANPEAPPLQEQEILAWMSEAPAGDSAFRLPDAALYRLQVSGGDVDCEFLVDATSDAGRTFSTTDIAVNTFEVENGSLVFRFDLEGSGHYEFPTHVMFENETHEFMIWAGKLHSHGGPVEFTVPDPLPGRYNVHWDAAPQGPDALFPFPMNAWVDVPNSSEADTKGASAPLGLLAVLVLAFAVRRR